ncbi:MAG: hypothetical protein VYE77_09980 [Planctomycetota bacterium]|nr:hypothetical protein [Planctomycetota bacterium]
MTGNDEQENRNVHDDQGHGSASSGEHGQVAGNDATKAGAGAEPGSGATPGPSVSDGARDAAETPLWQQLEEADSFLLETDENELDESLFGDAEPDVVQPTSMESLLMAKDEVEDVHAEAAGQHSSGEEPVAEAATDPVDVSGADAGANDSVAPADIDDALESAKAALDQAGWNEVSPESLTTDFQVESDAADVLFQEIRPQNVSESFEAREPFREEGGRAWAGNALPADEIGVPVDQDAHLIDDDLGFDGDQELELVSDDAGLTDGAPVNQGAASTDDDWAPVASQFVEDVTDGETTQEVVDEVDGDFFLLEDCDEEEFAAEEQPEYPVEAGWEPMAEGQQEDPWSDDDAQHHEADYEQDLYGEAAGLEEVEGEFAHQVDHDSEHLGDELYHSEQAPTPVAVAPRRSMHVMRMVASLAAAIMVVGAGAVVVLRPEWFGLQFEPSLVERVQVNRPAVQVAVATPALPEVVAPQTGSQAESVAASEGGEAPADGPSVQPEVVAPLPVVPEPVVPAPVIPSTNEEVVTPQLGAASMVPEAPLESPDMPAGQELLIGQFVPERQQTSWANVQLCSRAFAQLYNGNFFIGMVKSFAEGSLLLRVPDGEVRLARDEVQALTTLDSVEYAELQKATSGSLRLSNNNRLSGAILDSVVDDNYVLQMRADRIVVPKSVVAQFEQQGGSEALQFGDENAETQWLRELAVRHLRAMSVGEEPEDPLPTVGDDPTRNLPLPRAPRFPAIGVPTGASPNK